MSILVLSAITNTRLKIPGAEPWHADPQDPALSVMTDFREHASVTVTETAKIDEALEHMKHTGVRSAFAIDDQNRVVVGLITAYDITTVADVSKLFSEWPLTHIPVVETNEDGERHLRGMLSAAKVKRLLSTPGEQHGHKTRSSPEFVGAKVARRHAGQLETRRSSPA